LHGLKIFIRVWAPFLYWDARKPVFPQGNIGDLGLGLLRSVLLVGAFSKKIDGLVSGCRVRNCDASEIRMEMSLWLNYQDTTSGMLFSSCVWRG